MQHSAGRSEAGRNAADGSGCQREGKKPQGNASHDQNGSSTATTDGQGNQPSNSRAQADGAFTQLNNNGAGLTQGSCGRSGSNGVIAGADSNGSGIQYRMPTQQELIAAGRMDLLNAMRTWGGFTAVADLMGVLPNTRYTILASLHM